MPTATRPIPAKTTANTGMPRFTGSYTVVQS